MTPSPGALWLFGLGLLLGWWLHRLISRRQRLEAGGRRPGTGADQGLQRLQLLSWLEAAPQGWLVLDPQLRIRVINARAQRLLQLPLDCTSLGSLWPDVIAQPALEEAIRSVGRHGRAQRLEWWLGGQPLEAVLMPGEEGWVALWINSRRSLESQLDQQSRWVSDVAHELKTPLTALILVGDSLAAQATSSNAVLVERLQRELQRLQSLVGDLLELSRLENSLPRDERRYEVLDLCVLVEGAWSSLRPLAERRRVGLALSCQTGCPLKGDGSRLHRALLNLFDNALRYSPDGGVVEVSVRGSGLFWEVVVRDHGPGLSEEDEAHMFERFYRGDPSRVRSQSAGSGLGLAIVQQIALSHGGRVQGRNHGGGGAVMELVLPKGA